MDININNKNTKNIFFLQKKKTGKLNFVITAHCYIFYSEEKFEENALSVEGEFTVFLALPTIYC